MEKDIHASHKGQGQQIRSCLSLDYWNNLCSLEHGELEHKLNNCYNSVLASPFLQGAAPALVRVLTEIYAGNQYFRIQ
jgi:hypothetical protein